MQTLRQDLRYAWRRLTQKPVFTISVVLILALGIGANTAVFSVVNSVILAPLPYDESHKLIVIKETNPAKTIEPANVSPGNFLDLEAQETIFDSVTAWYDTVSTIQSEQNVEQVTSAQVSVDFFNVLRTQPALGKLFQPGEISGAAFETGQFFSGDRVVVIGDSLWRRHMGADPDVIGKKININRNEWQIIAVMAPDFGMPRKDTELWIPWDIARTYNSARFPQGPPRDWRFLRTLGRLKPAVTQTEAQSRLSSFYAGIAERYPATNRGWSAASLPLHDEVVQSSRLILFLLLGAVAMVLLLACANVAGLVLAQSAGRQREFVLRLALGASRQRLIRLLLTESFLLAFIGGLLGVGVAWLGLDTLLSLAPADTPRLNEVAIDARVLVFALLLAVGAAIVFGLLPALKIFGSNLSGALKSAGMKGVAATETNLRLRNALVIAEVSLALVLITCAGLFVRSFVQLVSVNPGFDSHNLLTMHITLDSAVYDRRAAEYYRQVIERIEGVPEVVSAGAVTTLPMSEVGVDFQRPYWRKGDLEPKGDGEKVAVRMATPGYFQTMGISLREGRNFNDHDRRETVAIMLVNKSMAEKVWPGESAVGKQLMLDYNRGKYLYEVVGVTEDLRYYGLKKEPAPEVFIPHAQNAYLPMNVVVRTSSDPARLIETIKAQVRGLDATQPVSNVITMDQLVSRSIATDRFSMWLLGSLAALALLLATTGLFSLLSYFVSRRTHELAVRVVLGAQHRDISKLVLGQGAVLLLAGIGLGLIASFICTRFFASLLFGVGPTDPLTFLITPALLSVVGVLACYIPARRATKVEPSAALRAE
jgi:putative ABC transport system permease protein